MKNLFKSRLVLLFVMLANMCLAQGNLTVSGDLTLNSGEYGVIELKNNAQLTIDGSVKVGNFNPINKSAVKVRITSTGQLTISSSLNMNGNYTLINEGILRTGNVELQNGINCLKNTGTHYVTGDLQISSQQSSYLQYGKLFVSNYINFHTGSFENKDCAYTETVGLNVNMGNVVSGYGHIWVKENMNLNQVLTTSADITIWYGTDAANFKFLNDPSKLGSAKKLYSSPCNAPLALKYDNVAVHVTEDTDEYLNVKVSFKVLENTNLRKMVINYSLDAKEWRTVIAAMPSDFKPGVTYAGNFKIYKSTLNK